MAAFGAHEYRVTAAWLTGALAQPRKKMPELAALIGGDKPRAKMSPDEMRAVLTAAGGKR